MELLTMRHGVVVRYEADPDAEDLRNQRRRVKECPLCHLDPCPVETAQARLAELRLP